MNMLKVRVLMYLLDEIDNTEKEINELIERMDLSELAIEFYTSETIRIKKAIEKALSIDYSNSDMMSWIINLFMQITEAYLLETKELQKKLNETTESPDSPKDGIYNDICDLKNVYCILTEFSYNTTTHAVNLLD